MTKNELRIKAELLARKIAPKDSNRLARSIKSMNTPNGFTLIQNIDGDNYGQTINDGRTDRPMTAKEQKNVGWWTNRVYNGVTRLVATNQNGNRTEHQHIAKWAENTPETQEEHTKNLAGSGK